MTKYIKIYGERNTGTNYLSKLIAHNLHLQELPGSAPSYIRRVEACTFSNELLRDLYFKYTFSRNLGWKHCCIPPIDKYLRIPMVNEKMVAFVSLTKNPYSWLLSLYKRPYHQKLSSSSSFEKFLTTPWQIVGREGVTDYVSSPIDLWNIKNASYIKMGRLGGLNFTSEHLLEHPDMVIDQLAEQFGVRLKEEKFKDHKESTKEIGKDSNFYRDYYLKEKWKSEISTDAISLINSSIDKELMSIFGYSVLS